MIISFKASIVAMGYFLLVSSLYGQVSQQRACARQVANNMEATRTKKPKVFATIRHYTFEWSKTRDACVMVIQYRTSKDGIPMVQIVATNATTMQPMEGYKNIFLVPESDEKQIEDATDSLFEKYSH